MNMLDSAIASLRAPAFAGMAPIDSVLAVYR